MESYKEQYSRALENLNEAKRIIISSVASHIKCVAGKPVRVGNHWFYVVEHNGVEVPAYCHMNNYDERNPKFLPIYDENNTGEFGWSDFTECCRIFELIKNRLLGIEEPLWKRR